MISTANLSDQLVISVSKLENLYFSLFLIIKLSQKITCLLFDKISQKNQAIYVDGKLVLDIIIINKLSYSLFHKNIIDKNLLLLDQQLLKLSNEFFHRTK